MKQLILLCFALVGASSILGRELRNIPDVCSKGQSYWCQNITTAAQCSAVKHCIQGVWEHERPIEVDKSQICQTCLDMVKQARDQLLSNITQEEIKQVLEGSCILIPVKIVREECVKLMDQFGPELVDTLASQMDPQIVCSVAGLCDNNRVHQLEEEYYHKDNHGSNEWNCGNCNRGVDAIRHKFNVMEPNAFLNILTKVCRNAGSYSDGCFDIALKEHEKMLFWLRRNMVSRPLCMLAGACRVEKHHSTPLVKANSVSVRVIQPHGLSSKDDLPCELCVQLVQHLRDILVANTTEEDFKLVLTGLCNQMTAYKDECLQYVDAYYDVAYKFLITELDGQVLCKEISICPGDLITNNDASEFTRPLVRVDTAVDSNSFSLPVTRYNPLTYVPSTFVSNDGSNDKTLCSMCEFFLHFVQQELTLPSTEQQIRDIVDKGCVRLPSSISSQCRAFVDTYMDEFVALLAQEIDPSQVCPMLGVCPRSLIAVSFNDKPDCPLCLLAFQEIHMKLKNKTRTTEAINDIVDDLCIRDEFPESLSMDCVNFITQNRGPIVDMVLTEFTPQESCVYIDLCIPHELIKNPPPNNPAGDIETNEIKQNPDVEDPNICVLCEFVMTKLAIMLKDKKTEEEIKDAVFHVCDIMPKTVTPKCRQFITQYADLVIELLAQEMDPKQVCTAINLCASAQALVRGSMEKCLFCEVLMEALKTVLTDPDVDSDINHQLRIACHRVPDRLYQTCMIFTQEFAPQIEMALRTLPIGPLVCRRFMTCHEMGLSARPVPSRSKCIRGSSYWCISSAHAAMCNAIDFCQKEVWHGEKPKKSVNKGQVVVSY